MTDQLAPTGADDAPVEPDGPAWIVWLTMARNGIVMDSIYAVLPGDTDEEIVQTMATLAGNHVQHFLVPLLRQIDGLGKMVAHQHTPGLGGGVLLGNSAGEGGPFGPAQEGSTHLNVSAAMFKGELEVGRPLHEQIYKPEDEPTDDQ